MSAFDRIILDQSLKVGDYLQSPSRLYFGTLEADGQFKIYRGSNPSDPHKTQVWTTGRTVERKNGSKLHDIRLATGPFHSGWTSLQIAYDHIYDDHGKMLDLLWSSEGTQDLVTEVAVVIGDDGRLCLMQGGKEVHWINRNFSDPVAEFKVKSIYYEVPRAKIKTTSDVGVLEGTLQNDTDTEQVMQISDKTTRTVTSNWSNATGLKMTLTGSVTAGVPGVASKTVTVSAEVSNTFTLGETKLASQEVYFVVALKVPPRKKFRAWVNVLEAEFEVPYTVTGDLSFTSGAKIMDHTLSGVYTGRSSFKGEAHVEDLTTGAPRSVPSNHIVDMGKDARELLRA